MSYRLAFDLPDPETGQTHPLVLSGGLWHGDVMLYDFLLPDHGISGQIECDWRSSGPRYTLEQGDASGARERGAIEELTRLLRPFFQGTFAGFDDAQLASLYPGDYHRRSGYCDENSEIEKLVKGQIAELVVNTLRPRKVLDAGCAGGLLVRELRQRGVDAHGFDHCPDLDRVVVPEMRPFVRQGSVTSIPYGPEDRFDTIVCIDVFEHIPEDRVPEMVREFERLGARHLAVHISHTELEHHGHITLRPLSWWDRQLGPTFRRAQVTGGTALVIPRPIDPHRLLRIYQRVESPVTLSPVSARTPASTPRTAAPPASAPR